MPLHHYLKPSGRSSEGRDRRTFIRREDPNRKNGKTKKKVRSTLGEFELETPRDRASTFTPKIIGKRQKNLPSDIERQIFALYARGSSLGDIRDFMEEMYGVEISPATISRVTDKVLRKLRNGETGRWKVYFHLCLWMRFITKSGRKAE